MGGVRAGNHAGVQSSVSDFNGQYDDLQGPVNQGTGVALLTYEQYRGAPFKNYFMRHDQNDELNYIYQLRHRWQRGTSVHPHIHLQGMSTWAAADLTKNLYWLISYVWVATGSVVPDLAGWTTVPVTMPIAKADQFKDLIIDTNIDIAPPPGAKESSIVRVQYIRAGTNILDTYNDNKVGGTGAANLAVIDFDLHFQQDKSGTPTEFPV